MFDEHKQRIEDVILQLLKERGNDKTICPSEAARVMARQDGHPERWRDWLKQARTAAISMSGEGSVIMLQRGEHVDPDTVKGAIRLRLP